MDTTHSESLPQGKKISSSLKFEDLENPKEFTNQPFTVRRDTLHARNAKRLNIIYRSSFPSTSLKIILKDYQNSYTLNTLHLYQCNDNARAHICSQ